MVELMPVHITETDLERLGLHNGGESHPKDYRNRQSMILGRQIAFLANQL